MHNTTKQEVNLSDNRSVETKSQFTDQIMQESKMTQICLNSVVLDMDKTEPQRARTSQQQFSQSSTGAIRRTKYVPGSNKNCVIQTAIEERDRNKGL